MCLNKCENCVYYYEETDFCLNHMYSAKNYNNDCTDYKSKLCYPDCCYISNDGLEFSEEITDMFGDLTTIGQMFDELKKINAEVI